MRISYLANAPIFALLVGCGTPSEPSSNPPTNAQETGTPVVIDGKKFSAEEWKNMSPADQKALLDGQLRKATYTGPLKIQQPSDQEKMKALIDQYGDVRK